MKKTIGFTSSRTLVLILATVAVGFAVTRIAMSTAKAPTAEKKGGIDNAMEQARRLVAELKEADWNIHGVDQSLLRLPEQDYVQAKVFRSPDMTSFAIPRGDPVYDEVALYSSTFVNWVPKDGKSGASARTGYYIVAWMDGRVNTVDVADVRYFPVPGKDDQMLYVFPGMDEYDAALKYLPGTREDLAAKQTSGDGS